MADTVVSAALKFPQDEGFPNISDGSENWDSAGYFMALSQVMQSGSYVRSDSELTFTGHDGTADQVDVTAGRAYLDLSGITLNVQSTIGGSSSPSYDTALASLPLMMVELPSTVENLDVQDSTLSQVWLAYDTDGTGPGSAGSVYLRSDDTGSVSAPSHPSVELGEANPDDSTADVLKNRFADLTYLKDSEFVVEYPTRPPIAALENNESIEVPVRVPNGSTLEVYRWGAYDASDDSTPTDLDAELLDGADTVQASENTANTEDTENPIASHTNATGSLAVYKLRARNETGSAIDSPGVGFHVGFRVV